MHYLGLIGVILAQAPETDGTGWDTDGSLFGPIPSVTGASKYEQPISEAPASVTVITADEIRRYGWQTLAELLGSVRGMYGTWDRDYHYIGVRGFAPPGDYNTRVLLLLDGHRLPDPTYGGSYIGRTAVVRPSDLERVEIVRGPGSSLYGTNAVLAVVNLITRKGRDVGGTEVGVTGEVHGAATASASWGDRLKSGLEARGAVSFTYDAGRDHFYPELAYDGFDGMVRGADAETAVHTNLRLDVRDLTLQVYGVHRSKQVPTAPWDSVPGPGTVSHDTQLGIGLRWDHTAASGVHGAVLVDLNGYRYWGVYLYDYADPDDAEPWLEDNIDGALAVWANAEARVTVPWRAQSGTAGVEVRVVPFVDQYNYDRSTAEIYLDDHAAELSVAAYAQADLRPVPAVQVSIGGRVDANTSWGIEANPRLAAILHATRTTSFKASWGRAFRAPTLYELRYHDGETQKTNPGLGAERIDTIEADVEQTLGSRGALSLAAYRYTLRRLIGLKLDPADDRVFFDNIDRATAFGLELGGTATVPDKVQVRGSYALQLATNADTGERLSNAPVHVAKLLVSPTVVPDRLHLTSELRVTGPRSSPGGVFTPWAVVWDVGVVAEITRSLTASLYVDDLLDLGEEHPASSEHAQETFLQDGREARLRVEFRF